MPSPQSNPPLSEHIEQGDPWAHEALERGRTQHQAWAEKYAEERPDPAQAEYQRKIDDLNTEVIKLEREFDALKAEIDAEVVKAGKASFFLIAKWISTKHGGRMGAPKPASVKAAGERQFHVTLGDKYGGEAWGDSYATEYALRHRAGSRWSSDTEVTPAKNALGKKLARMFEVDDKVQQARKELNRLIAESEMSSIWKVAMEDEDAKKAAKKWKLRLGEWTPVATWKDSSGGQRKSSILAMPKLIAERGQHYESMMNRMRGDLAWKKEPYVPHAVYYVYDGGYDGTPLDPPLTPSEYVTEHVPSPTPVEHSGFDIQHGFLMSDRFSGQYHDGKILSPFGEMIRDLQKQHMEDREKAAREAEEAIIQSAKRAKEKEQSINQVFLAGHATPTQVLYVNGKAFREMFLAVAKAIAKDDSRPVLTNVHMEYESGTLRMIASDGFRIFAGTIHTSIKTQSADTLLEWSVNFPAKVRSDQYQGMARYDPKPDDELKLEYVQEAYFERLEKVSEDLIAPGLVVRFPNGKFVAAAQPGRFPNWRQLVPEVYGLATTFNADQFKGALNKVRKAAKDNNGIVQLVMVNQSHSGASDGALVVSAKSNVSGEESVRIQADLTPIVDKPQYIAFNWGYLEDIAHLPMWHKMVQTQSRVVKEAPRLTLKTTTYGSPAVFEGTILDVIILMPMFVQLDKAALEKAKAMGKEGTDGKNGVSGNPSLNCPVCHKRIEGDYPPGVYKCGGCGGSVQVA